MRSANFLDWRSGGKPAESRPVLAKAMAYESKEATFQRRKSNTGAERAMIVFATIRQYRRFIARHILLLGRRTRVTNYPIRESARLGRRCGADSNSENECMKQEDVGQCKAENSPPAQRPFFPSYSHEFAL
jgi:hypothetical protein